jgi:cyclic pyranopterin phosphate synthase
VRKISKLRISLTESCQMRCRYCMPDHPKFPEENSYLPLTDLFKISKSIILDSKISKVRITGGEPLLRSGLVNFLKDLKTLPVEIGITTNGILLHNFLDDFLNLNILDLNISLDSLNYQTLQKISPNTSRSQFEVIMKNIELALKLGFRIKLNTVVMKENFSEINHLASWAFERNMTIRFLELMSMGVANSIFSNQFVAKSEMFASLNSFFGNLESVQSEYDSTSENYLVNNKFKLGFISSESEPFCDSCSRMRLSAHGELFGCLMKNDKVAIKLNELDQIHSLVNKAWAVKPQTRIYQSTVVMNQIGG